MTKSKILYRIAFSLGLIAIPFAVMMNKDNLWDLILVLILLLPVFILGIYAAHIEQKEIMNKTDCPEFKDENYEKILEWANAKVVYDYNWTLLWEHGFIGFTAIKTEDEPRARMAAALFIYFWCKGVNCSIASSCAELYSYMVEKHDDSNRETN